MCSILSPNCVIALVSPYSLTNAPSGGDSFCLLANCFCYFVFIFLTLLADFKDLFQNLNIVPTLYVQRVTYSSCPPLFFYFNASTPTTIKVNTRKKGKNSGREGTMGSKLH